MPNNFQSHKAKIITVGLAVPVVLMLCAASYHSSAAPEHKLATDSGRVISYETDNSWQLRLQSL